MKAFVLDASIALAWILGEPGDAASHAAADALGEAQALVPPIFPLEVTNVMSGKIATRRITLDAGSGRLDWLLSLDLRHVDIDAREIIAGVLPLALRRRLTTYDASYLFLAAQANVPLATLDRDLAKAAQAEGVALVGG